MTGRKLPWYCFLYRLLGAQGTFVLWLLVPLALWWTFEPALIRLENRQPTPTSVREARTGWIQTTGVLVELDRRLLLHPEAPGLPPVPVLLDPESAAGQWWAQTLALARQSEAPDPALAEEARIELVRRFARLQGNPAEFLPAPGRGILLQGKDVAPLSAAPAPATSRRELADFHAETQDRIERVLARVSAPVTVQGILEQTPPVLVRRLGEELSLIVPRRVLGVDRRPRELESVVFGVSAILLLFLAVGLIGARSPSSPPTPETTL